MAKQTLMIRVVLLEDYLNGKDSIVDVVLSAIENHDYTIFERLRSEEVKDNVLSGVDNMWQHAVEIAAKDAEAVKEIKRDIQIVFDDLEHARTCLKLGGCTLYGRLSYYWKIFRMKCAKIPLQDVMSLHIAEHGNDPAEREELRTQLNQQICTLRTLHYMFEAYHVRKDAPQSAPAGTDAYQVDQVPYLAALVKKFQEKFYEEDILLRAWRIMLDKKARKIDSSKWNGFLEPEDALYVLFEKMTYDEVNRHFKAYVALLEKDL